MRKLLVLLLIANLVALAAQFTVVRRAIFGDANAARPAQLNAERLRIVRDTSARAVSAPTPAPAPAP